MKSTLIDNRIKEKSWQVEETLIKNDSELKDNCLSFYKTCSENIKGINVVKADNYVHMILINAQAKYHLAKLLEELLFLENIILNNKEIITTSSKKMADKYLTNIEMESSGEYVGIVNLEDIEEKYVTNDFFFKINSKGGETMVNIEINGNNNIAQVGNENISNISSNDVRDIIDRLEKLMTQISDKDIEYKNEIIKLTEIENPTHEDIKCFSERVVSIAGNISLNIAASAIWGVISTHL